MSAMSLSQIFDYLSARLNASEADGEDFRINLVVNDTADKAVILVRNSVLNFWVNESSADANVTVYMPRRTLEQLALDPSVPPADVNTTGDQSVFEQFVGMLDLFSPGFNIILP